MNPELSDALNRLRSAIWSSAALSLAINLMTLTGSIFMLAVYDRVIPSSSIASLVGLCLMVVVAYTFQAFLETLRLRILGRIGSALQESFGPRTFDLLIRGSAGGKKETSSALRDFDNVRGFVSSLGMAAIFDLPWVPIFLIIAFLFHPLIGATALCGAIILVGIAVWAERSTQSPSKDLAAAMARRGSLLASTQGNAETIQAMGMAPGLSLIWRQSEKRVIDRNLALADLTSATGSLSRALRALLQSLVLAVGAYLVIEHIATGGIMIASSIITARAMAPIDLSIANWRNFVQARQSWAKLGDFYKNAPVERVAAMPPRPAKRLAAEGLAVVPPGAPKPVLSDVSFTLNAGSAMGLIGPSGSGKSTLARALVGIWAPQWGQVRYDGATLSQWSATEKGKFVGYLSQDVSLFEGTIAQNIARFDPEANMEQVLKAAASAHVHELIVALPGGYDTIVTGTGTGLSGGQRQRIGLARALFGEPFIVVLDEPSSNLDAEGESALLKAVAEVRARGGIVVMVTHRPNMLSAVDMMLVLNRGRVQGFGPREEIMAKMMPSRPAPPPVAVTSTRPASSARIS